MCRQRTTPILVLAILHLVGGGLGLIYSLCGCGGLLMSNAISSAMPTVPRRPGQPPPPIEKQLNDYLMKELNDRIPGYLAFTFGGLGVDFLLDGMLLLGGIGLLSVEPWARWLSLVYAPISIVVHLVSFVYVFVWILPATKALGMSSFATTSGEIGMFVNLLIVIYPITVLIILLLPSTAAAFREEIPDREEDQGLRIRDYPSYGKTGG